MTGSCSHRYGQKRGNGEELKMQETMDYTYINQNEGRNAYY